MGKTKRKIICYDCRNQTSNPYSRLVDGREVQICYQCSNKRVKMLVEEERLAAWNAWVKA